MNVGTRAALLLGLASLMPCVGGCSRPAGASPAEPLQHKGPRWVFILDPTVDKGDSARQVLRQLPDLIKRDGELVVWFVQDRLIADGDPTILRYQINRNSKAWADELREQVKRDAESIAKTFDSRWAQVHDPVNKEIAKSCIVTALSEASRYIEKSTEKRPSNLIVVSDFLEVCGDSKGVNLEQHLLQTSTLLSGPTSVNFESVASAGFLRARSHLVTVRAQQDRLEQLWKDAANRYRIQKTWYGEEVSQLMGFFRTEH